MLFDFFPVLLFFLAYKLSDIYVATGVLIAACAVQMVAQRLWRGAFDRTQIITFMLVLIFGGATLMLHDEQFIKWKPTVINWLFGLVFLGSHVIGRMTMIQRMLGGRIELPTHAWSRLNAAWGVFFIALGILNLYVAFSFDTETWVNFKLFGLMGLTLAFVLLQSLYLARFLPASEGVERDGR